LSYRDAASFPQIAAVAVLAGPLASLATLSFEPLWVSLMTIAGLAFLAMTTLRLSTALNPVPIEPRRRPRRWRSQDLPIYTVIVPLYREGRVLPRLLAALSALDYPRSKLQAMLVVEAEDDETRAALARSPLPAFVEVIVAPPGEPRTKPRALNIALELARGAFTTVYDAENVPHLGQLRLAVATFAASGPEVACCQARLAIDNTEDG
jgi:cellulose synthase/poly-beta-1,6-N-acetylglucosamine synthase-like glycosyltransferase